VSIFKGARNVIGAQVLAPYASGAVAGCQVLVTQSAVVIPNGFVHHIPRCYLAFVAVAQGEGAKGRALMAGQAKLIYKIVAILIRGYFAFLLAG